MTEPIPDRLRLALDFIETALPDKTETEFCDCEYCPGHTHNPADYRPIAYAVLAMEVVLQRHRMNLLAPTKDREDVKQP